MISVFINAALNQMVPLVVSRLINVVPRLSRAPPPQLSANGPAKKQ
jgi:hypothetical protein